MITRCLIIDDEPLAREGIARYIDQTDFLDLVGTGNNPVELTRLLDIHNVDLIFLDITMPELDGYQTCTLIRNAEDTRNTPVVMLSSSDGIFDIAKGQARGATAHVTKIPPESVLRELIFNHTGRKAAA